MLKPIAQELASTIAKTIGYDVLITDTDGIIIGCSDLSRGLGTLNEACAMVASSGVSRTDTEEDAKRLKGTKSGVTYPISDMDGRVAGAIAITGDPTVVKPFAELVAKQAELYLRERFIASELQDRERNFQGLVSDIALYRDGVNDPRIVESRASLMGYSAERQYTVLVVDTTESRRCSEENERAKFMYEVKREFDDMGDMSGPVGPNRYAILHAISPDEHPIVRVTFFQKLQQRAQKLIDYLEERHYTGRIGIGGIYSGVKGLSISYREAMEALQIGRQSGVNEQVHCIMNYRIEQLLLTAETSMQDEHVARELSSLFARNDGEELQDTVVAWCESGFSVVKASELLHVHRTTVDYRLEKLHNLLAVEPRDFREMSRLYWAVMLWRNGRGADVIKYNNRRRQDNFIWSKV